MEQEKEQQEQRYMMQLGALNENLGTLRSDLMQADSRSRDLEKSLEDLKGEKHSEWILKWPSRRIRFRRRSGFLLWHAEWITNSFVTKIITNCTVAIILSKITRWILISEKSKCEELILKQN